MATRKTTKATSPAKRNPNAFEVVEDGSTTSQTLAKLVTGGVLSQETTTMTKATTPLQALGRVQTALEAAQAYPEGQHPPEVLNELADALQAAPESYRQHPGMDEWMQWAQSHTERRQHGVVSEFGKNRTLRRVTASDPKATVHPIISSRSRCNRPATAQMTVRLGTWQAHGAC